MTDIKKCFAGNGDDGSSIEQCQPEEEAERR
jgi:hypothetical protein